MNAPPSKSEGFYSYNSFTVSLKPTCANEKQNSQISVVQLKFWMILIMGALNLFKDQAQH